MKKLVILLSLLALSLSASAQDAKENRRVIDAKFVAISTSMVAASIFDMETTFSAIKNPGVHEGNPIMRPFVNAGRPATYAFIGGMDAGTLWLAYRAKKNPNPAIRKLWWLAPAIATATHAFAGGANLRFTFH